MALPRPINDPHSSAPDFFQNLIITYTPIGVTYIEFPEQIIKRFLLRRSCGGSVTVAPISADPRGKKAAQTQTASDARRRTGGPAQDEVRMVNELWCFAN